MGKLFLVIIIFVTAVSALVRPWVGITAYYLLAILGPQYIWWWNFEGLRVSLLVALFTLAGVTLQVLNNKYNFNFLLNRQNFWLAVLWFCIVFSYFTGPYVDSFATSGLNPDQLFSLINTIFLFYFCAVLEINQLQKLRYLVIIFAFSTIFLIGWANNQYLTQNWSQFNMGRLMGPSSIEGGSLYGDENNFAMIFVTGIPFIYYLGWELQRKWQRCLLWGTIPLGFHAVFLTGSRGGLVGLGAVVLLMVLLSSRKLFAIPILVIIIFFYQWQAGDVMKQRGESIVDYQGESAAETRIVAWKGGLRMITAHPISGVGLGSFVTALPKFINSPPRVAHNTFIQFAAESGVVAGLAYLMIVGMFFLNSLKIRSWCCKRRKFNEIQQIVRFNDASMVSFGGLIVCSFFLSLNAFELFFFLLIFSNALFQMCLNDTEMQNMPLR